MAKTSVKSFSQSLGVLEVRGMTAGIQAMDVMCKSADVEVVGTRIFDSSILIVLHGEFNAVSAVLEMGVRQARELGAVVVKQVIAKPHAETLKLLQAMGL